MLASSIKVEASHEIYITDRRLVLRSERLNCALYLKDVFWVFSEKEIDIMSNENQQPVAPGTTKSDTTKSGQANTQQNQGDAKPGTKPSDQQK